MGDPSVIVENEDYNEALKELLKKIKVELKDESFKRTKVVVLGFKNDILQEIVFPPGKDKPFYRLSWPSPLA